MSSLGILCAWYSKSSESNVLTLSPHSTLQKERIEELGMDDTGEEIVVVEEVKEKNKEDEKNVEEIIHFYVPMSSLCAHFLMNVLKKLKRTLSQIRKVFTNTMMKHCIWLLHLS